MSGPQRLTWVDLDAWLRVRKLTLTNLELRLICILDDEYLQFASEELKGQNG